MMLPQLQSALGILALLGHRLGPERRPTGPAPAPHRRRGRPATAHRRAGPQAPGHQGRLHGPQRGRAGPPGRDPGRHGPGLRLSRRGRGPLRRGLSAERLCAGLPRPAADPGGERPVRPALSLAHPAGGGARLRLGPAPHPGDRRGPGPGGRGQHLRRHDRGPTAHSPLPGGHDQGRAVRPHDHRHGHHRRDRDGALRRHPRDGHPRRPRTHPHRLPHQRPGGPGGGRGPGAGARAQPATPTPSPWCVNPAAPWMPSPAAPWMPSR